MKARLCTFFKFIFRERLSPAKSISRKGKKCRSVEIDYAGVCLSLEPELKKCTTSRKGNGVSASKLFAELFGFILCCSTTQLTAADCDYPTAAKCCKSSFYDGHLTLGADWLYWKVMEDGLSPGTIVTGDPYVSSDKNTINHNCKYNNGFRVNLGYELPSDSWGVGISYTYMPATARTPTFSITDLMTWAYAPNSNDFPILDPLSSISPTREVFTSRWTATLNCADVDLSRIVCLGDCLQMRPHIGFRAFWMTQRLRVNLDYTLDTATEESVDVILRQHFTSCGVEGGLWATWNIGCGFSFLGHIGGSILSSKFTIPQHATFIVMTDEDSETEILTESYIEDTIHSCTPTADYFVGLQYDDIFCEVVFSLIAGWEQHVVFDVNRLSSIPGNLATQGLTLSFKARF